MMGKHTIMLPTKKFEVNGTAAPSIASATSAGLSMLLHPALDTSASNSAASRRVSSPVTRAAAAQGRKGRQSAVASARAQRLDAGPSAASAAVLSPASAAMQSEAVDGLMQLAQPAAGMLLRRSTRKKRKRELASC